MHLTRRTYSPLVNLAFLTVNINFDFAPFEVYVRSCNITGNNFVTVLFSDDVTV